jgi:hypothetical protein
LRVRRIFTRIEIPVAAQQRHWPAGKVTGAGDGVADDRHGGMRSSFMAVATATAYCSTNTLMLRTSGRALPGRVTVPLFLSTASSSGLRESASEASDSAATRHARSGSIPLPRAVTSRDKPFRKNTSGTIGIRQIGRVLGRSDCDPCQIR